MELEMREQAGGEGYCEGAVSPMYAFQSAFAFNARGMHPAIEPQPLRMIAGHLIHADIRTYITSLATGSCSSGNQRINKASLDLRGLCQQIRDTTKSGGLSASLFRIWTTLSNGGYACHSNRYRLDCWTSETDKRVSIYEAI